MNDGVRRCPRCERPLVSNYRAHVIVWECGDGHGIGVNIFDAVGYLQRDEIDAIWNGVRGAPVSKLPSPVNGRPMFTVTFMADEDTDYDNVGSNAREMTVDLDADNYFAWFTVDALNSMPTMENVTMPKTSASMVEVEDLDLGEQNFDYLFDDSAKDSGIDRRSGTLGSMLGGMARRLRNR
jgi:hypothetical protein